MLKFNDEWLLLYSKSATLVRTATACSANGLPACRFTGEP